MVRIPIHSMIDLITNSSTEIFVHSESSVKPAKDLLAELLKMENSEKTVDEVFTFSIETGDLSYFIEILADNMEDYDEETFNKLGLKDLNWAKQEEIVEQYVEDIENKKIKRPDYFDDLMDEHEINVDTYLVVKSNDTKYDHFLELLKKFLYSPDYQEGQR